MLIYLSINKTNYRSGQMAPFFIAILAILIIATLITVNVGKIALIRTHTTNGSDAGGLALGSVMATVFDSIAAASESMDIIRETYHAYLDGYYDVAYDYYMTALVLAISAEVLAAVTLGVVYASACATLAMIIIATISLTLACNYMSRFNATISVIADTVQSFYETQRDYYQSLRDSIDEAVDSAIQTAHKFVFYNSAISLPDYNKEGWSHSSDDYDDFLESIGSGGSYTFSWTDGHSRNHSVTSRVNVAKVVTYTLQHTKWDNDKLQDEYEEIQDLVDYTNILWALAIIQYTKPWLPSAMRSMMSGGSSLGNALDNWWEDAWDEFYKDWGDTWDSVTGDANSDVESQDIEGILWFACAFEVAATACLGIGRAIYYAAWNPEAWEMYGKGIVWGLAWEAAGLILMYLIHDKTKETYRGLRCTKQFRSSSDSDFIPKILCWIVDVDHSRTGWTEASQSHQGEILGLWTTTYPSTSAHTDINFLGGGVIWPPIQEHDPVITGTD